MSKDHYFFHCGKRPLKPEGLRMKCVYGRRIKLQKFVQAAVSPCEASVALVVLRGDLQDGFAYMSEHANQWG